MNLARYIDHTILKAEATKADVETLCREAKTYHFASVCINTCYVPLAASLLKDSDVKVCCTVGFPLGAMATKSKAFEAATAVADGAQEVDMVLNIGAMRAGDYDYVKQDIHAVVEALPPQSPGKSDFGNLPAYGGANHKSLRTVRSCGRGFCKNLHWLFHKRRHGRACGADEARRGR